jgi:hypothetical protein
MEEASALVSNVGILAKLMLDKTLPTSFLFYLTSA